MSVAISNYISSWTNYGQIEALLQEVVEREKLRASTKDFTPVVPIQKEDVLDLREEHGIMYKPKVKKGLFDKLKELKNDTE